MNAVRLNLDLARRTLNRVLESSVIVNVIRRITGGSTVVAAVGAIVRRVHIVGQGIQQAADSDPDTDAQRIRAIAKESRLVQALEQIAASPVLSWEHARVGSLSEKVRRATSALSLAQQIRLLGWMLVVATAVHGSLSAPSGAPIAPTTLLAWTVALGIGLAMMGASRRLATAWTERTERGRASEHGAKGPLL